MRRKILMVAMLFYVLCVSACVKNGSENGSATENTGNVKETAKETETQVEEETLYDFSNDENILWANINDQTDGDGRLINGIILYNDICEIYDGAFKAEGDELFAVSVRDSTKELTEMELYEGYVKGLNVKTEFYGVSEETIKKCLDEKYEYRKKMEKRYETRIEARIYIYITEKELKAILEKGCPEGMQIRLSWLHKADD